MSEASIQPQHVGKQEFRSDIQGLRAIAVLGVILFHSNRDWLPGGFVGVDVFFVISGFLIAGMVLQKRGIGQFSFVDFYLARARRIAPAYFVMLAVVTFCAAILFIPKDFEIYWESAKSAMYFGSNSYFSSFGDYFAPSSHELPLLHTWSLAIEMQFYVLVPALLVFLPEKLLKPTISIAILALLIFGVVLVTNGDKKAAYFSLWVRTPEFLIGVLLALFMQRYPRGKRFTAHIFFKDVLAALGLLLVLSSFIFVNESLDFPGVLIAFPCLGAAFVIAGYGGRITRILSSKPLVLIGGISYSLYLWHWPVLAFARYVYEKYEIAPTVLLILIPLVVILSYSSLRWVETPFRCRNWCFGKGVTRSALFVLAVSTPILTAQRVNASIDKPLSIEYSRYADPLTICHGRVVKECLRGSSWANESHPVLVLGDSHAAQLNLFFDNIGYKLGKQYRVISASSCVTIPGFDVDRLPGWARKDCRDQIDFAQRFIPESQEVIIAAMWHYQLQSERFVVALKDFFSASRVAGKNVTVLFQIPMLNSNVQRTRRFSRLGIRKRIQINDEWQSANRQIAAISAQYPNVKFLDFSEDDFFYESPVYQGELVYSDKDHLNEVGSALYADRAFEWFKK